MWPVHKERIRAAYGRFDSLVKEWVALYERGGGKIHCRRGCHNCCALAVNAGFGEALGVAGALSADQLPALARHVERTLEVAANAADLRGWLQGYRREAGLCPFLAADGACGVYPWRPFACRALLATRNADWCGVDLSTLHPLEKQAFLSGLDRSVAAWPTHYAAFPQDVALACEEEASGWMAGSFGFAISGNLPVLVWLERQFRLSEAIPEGRGAVVSLLEKAGVNSPFLLQLRG